MCKINSTSAYNMNKIWKYCNETRLDLHIVLLFRDIFFLQLFWFILLCKFSVIFYRIRTSNLTYAFRMRKFASFWTSPMYWIQDSWSAWIHFWLMEKFQVCSKEMISQLSWPNAKKDLKEKVWCLILMKNCTSGLHSKLVLLFICIFISFKILFC